MVLNEQTGSSYSKGYESLGFAGGLLLDLFLQGKIALTEGYIEVINSTLTGDDFLNSILEIIKTSDKKQQKAYKLLITDRDVELSVNSFSR